MVCQIARWQNLVNQCGDFEVDLMSDILISCKFIVIFLWRWSVIYCVDVINNNFWGEYNFSSLGKIKFQHVKVKMLIISCWSSSKLGFKVPWEQKIKSGLGLKGQRSLVNCVFLVYWVASMFTVFLFFKADSIFSHGGLLVLQNKYDISAVVQSYASKM